MDSFNIAIENDHGNSGFLNWKWWFSIVFCMFTRGYLNIIATHRSLASQSHLHKHRCCNTTCRGVFYPHEVPQWLPAIASTNNIWPLIVWYYMILYNIISDFVILCIQLYAIVWMDGCMHACMHACMYVCIYIYIYMFLSARVTAHSPMLRQNHVQPVQPGLKLGGFAAITAASFTERTWVEATARQALWNR